MSTETTLFLLRLLSGLFLLAILGALFVILWHDHRSVIAGVQAERRIYGQLHSLREVNGNYVPIGTNYPLLRLTSIGRSPSNSIMVDDSFASSEHALLSLRSGQWWLEDRRSRNGTTLNEIRITQPVVVTDGDIIGVGGLRFRIELEL